MATYNMISETFDGVASASKQCWCGICFALPKSLLNYYRRINEELPGSFSLYCPLGHAMVPAGRSESDKLRDLLAAEKHAREQEQAHGRFLSSQLNEARDEKANIERRLRGTRAVVTRMKRRAIAGRCPCCSDQFKDLERHMKAKHPNFDPDKGAEALAGKE